MIRAAIPADQGYIASTWARSILSGMRAGHAIRKHGLLRTVDPEAGDLQRRARQLIGKQIDLVMDRADTRGLVLVRDDRPAPGRDYIVGWVVYAEGPSVPLVHYAYVRDHDEDGHELRGCGVAGMLFDRIGIARSRAVVCTSDGPASDSMRGHFRASTHLPLQEFLK